MKEEKPNNQINNTVQNTVPQVTQVPTQTINNASIEPTNTVNNVTNPQNSTQPVEQNIEVLDEVIKEEPKQEKNSSMVSIFVIFGLLILFVIGLPFITSFINKDDNPATIDTNISNVKEYNTQNGKIKIGEESYLQVSDIKFYNFTRDSNNTRLKFNIIADKRITNINDKELYIELYNSGETLIYRQQFIFNETLEKSIIEPVFITLENNIYVQASYAKIVEYKDIKESIKKEEANYTYLTCTKEEILANEKISYKTTYTFNSSLLSSYLVNKNVTNLDGSVNEIENEALREEYNKIIMGDVTNNSFTNNSFTYTVNSEGKNYVTLDTIKNGAIEQGYTCE